MIVFYFYFQILYAKTSGLLLKVIPSMLVLAGASTFYVLKLPLFSVVFSFFLFFLITTFFFYQVPGRNFFLSLISFCIGNVIFLMAALIYLLLLVPFFPKTAVPPDFISMPVSFLISVLLVTLFFRFPKFRKGIRRIRGTQMVRLGIFVGLPTLLLLTIPHVYTSADNTFKIVPLYIITVYFLLFYFWQRQIRLRYLSRLRGLEMESLRQEIRNKDSKIEKLMKSNDQLAQTIHEDNKLIPAMLSAVTDYLESPIISEDKALAAQGEALAGRLKELGRKRSGLLLEFRHSENELPQTGHAAVDAMLCYMAKRAKTGQIDYQVILQPDFPPIIDTVITESDLTHLLSDLIENSIIAVRGAETKSILVQLGMLYNAPSVEISDSGIPFAPEVFEDFGLSRHSTHPGSGGSGIGLMDIWKIKTQYAASLHIHEYEPGVTPYSKKLSLVFDGKKHYIIQSFRAEELLQDQIRGDLYILPPDREIS